MLRRNMPGPSQPSPAEIHHVRAAPRGIPYLPEKQTRAHLGVVAGTMAALVGDVKAVAEVAQAVTAEVVQPAGGAQRAVVSQVRLRHAVQLQRAAQAADVEGGVVGHKHGAAVKVRADFAPHLGKIRRALRVLRPYSVYPHVPVAVNVALRAYEPRARLHHPAASHHAYASLTYRGALSGGRLKVNRRKVRSMHRQPSFLSV